MLIGCYEYLLFYKTDKQNRTKCKNDVSTKKMSCSGSGSMYVHLLKGTVYLFWLVVSTPLKNMKVTWDDDIPD